MFISFRAFFIWMVFNYFNTFTATGLMLSKMLIHYCIGYTVKSYCINTFDDSATAYSWATLYSSTVIGRIILYSFVIVIFHIILQFLKTKSQIIRSTVDKIVSRIFFIQQGYHILKCLSYGP